jgi:hypothetical protein
MVAFTSIAVHAAGFCGPCGRLRHREDDIGFDVKDLAAMVGRLETAGIKLDRPVVTQPSGAKLTFIHDAWGTSIELNERPNPL